MTERDPEGEDKSKLTGVGCVLMLLSVAVIFGVAIPIVQYRDPNGHSLPRMVAIILPVLIGAVFNAICTFLLRLVGLPVWSESDPKDSVYPEE